MMHDPCLEGIFLIKLKKAIILKPEGGIVYSNFIEATLKCFKEWKEQDLRPLLKRIFPSCLNEIFQLAENLIELNDAEHLIALIKRKIEEKKTDSDYFIPVILTPASVPHKPFSIGPITFRFIETQQDIIDFAFKNETKEMASIYTEQYCKFLERHNVNSLARVNIKNLSPEEGEKFAILAVDLACVAIQLLCSNEEYLEKIGTLQNRKGIVHKVSLIVSKDIVSKDIVSKDNVSLGSRNMEALRTFAPYKLNALLAYQENEMLNKVIVESIGSIINSLVSDNWRLPIIEQAWCDAAYWYQDALASFSDGAALAKYEASLENLVFSHNQSKGRDRLRLLFKVFYSFEEDRVLNTETGKTISQVIKEITTDRSRILHGSSSTIGKDWQKKRKQVAEITAHLLVGMSIRINRYANTKNAEDDWDIFIQWLEKEK